IEPSSAKTLKCRVSEADYPGWTAPKFIKSIDGMEGKIGDGRLLKGESEKSMQSLRYSLLVSEAGDKAVEIERYAKTGELRLYVTVYRPAGDVTQILETLPHIPAPPPVRVAVEAPRPPVHPEPAPAPVAAEIVPEPAPESAPPPVAPKKPDFRRLSDTPLLKIAAPEIMPEADAPPLTAFLIHEKKPARRPHFMVFDEILPPEIERVRCDMATAKLLIDASIARGVRVRDLLRQMTGLTTPAHDEVLFEMPLSEEDYMQLAQRYHLKPDRKSELRQRLMEEIHSKLSQV
ncbi:MAG: hypothetical protein ACK5QX_07135, partial [bacterium]